MPITKLLQNGFSQFCPAPGMADRAAAGAFFSPADVVKDGGRCKNMQISTQLLADIQGIAQDPFAVIKAMRPALRFRIGLRRPAEHLQPFRRYFLWALTARLFTH